MSSEVTRAPCPAPDAHRRLMDCHMHWHGALEGYMEPEGFRMSLNAMVQGLRSVTFLLQKRKASLPGFETWYPAWQASVKDDATMQWAVRARNRIVKEEDLELDSTARVHVMFDWAREEESTFSVVPRWTSQDIVQQLARQGLPVGVPEGQCTLTIERRWVDHLLPETELLDACAHVYGQLVHVVRTAHLEAEVDSCNLATRAIPCVTSDLEDRATCMSSAGDVRTAHFDLATLAHYRSKSIHVGATEEGFALARERYGDDLVLPPGDADAIGIVPVVFDMARRLLETDGYAIPMAWLMRGNRIVSMASHHFEDQTGKMAAFNSLARQVKLLGADGFCTVGELWSAPMPNSEALRTGRYTRASQHPDRKEAVFAAAVTRDGRFLSYMADFHREGDQIVVGEPSVKSSMVLMMFRPILKVWGLEDTHSMELAVARAEEREQQEVD